MSLFFHTTTTTVTVMNAKLQLLVLILLAPWISMAQKVDVSGRVVDATSGEPLTGATIVETGTTNGAFSDGEGAFRLSVNSEGTLTISYVGYQRQTVPISGAESYEIQMVSENTSLDEVVVVGYSTQKKADITGAISIVDMESIDNTPYSNVVQSLQGNATGVTLTQDGQPGGGRLSIKIRGITTLTNNNPLIVIDGVPTVESLDNINPNDVESIQILKDAASASIYGSRSAGGVIIITTKKGKEGVLNVDAGAQFSMQTLGRKIDLLNATEWGEVYWQAAQNDGFTPRHPLYGNGAQPVLNTNPFLIPNGKQIYQITEEGTDWYDEVYQNALQQQHYLNVSNGSKRGNYMFGVSYYDQDGLIKETYYDRITGRFNSQLHLNDWITIGENMSIAYSEEVQIGSQQGQDGIPLDVIRQHPALPVFDFEGNYAGKIGGLPDVRNMVSVLDKNQNNTTDSWRIFGNAYVQANLLGMFDALSERHRLDFKTSFGVDYSNFYDIRFQAAFSEGDFDIQNNLLTNAFGRGFTRTFTNTLQYGYEAGDHNFSVMGGMESVEYDFSFISAARNDFLIEDPDFTYLSAGAGDQTNAGGGDEWGLFSYFGRADYSFASKYILSATVRYDKTSRFRDNGLFPAASIGWWLSEEDFMKGLFKSGSSLKIRASYGQQGNQSASSFAILSTLGPDPNHGDYDIFGTNSGVVQGFRVIRRGNPNLRWETTAQTNIGFDLTLAGGSLDVVFDYYTKTTRDILLPAPQIAAVGEGDFPFVNAATVANQGVDLGINYRFTSSNGFGLDLGGQITYFTNEVVDIPAIIANEGYEGELYLGGGDGPTRITVGQPIGVFYGWVADGIFQNEAEVEAHADQTGKGVGRIRYQDINGDSVINDEDRTYLGDPYPTLSYGFNLVASYRNFSLSAALYGAFGQQVYNEVKWYMDFAQNGNFNRSTRLLNAWSPENPDSDIPAPTLSNANNENRASSYFVEDADFLRLRSIRLAYDLPTPLVGDYNVRLYAVAQNVFTLTNYSGIDPEVPFAGNQNFPGIDRGVYPLPRIYILGINFNL